MSVNSCDNGHKYDLWFLSEDMSMASRVCMNCGFVEVIPATKNILEQLKKQVDSKKLLDSFLTLSDEDFNLIGYLNVILDEAYYYINSIDKSMLNDKLKFFVSSNYLSEENKFFIKTFSTAIRDNDINLLCDTLEIFQKFNVESLNNFIDIDVQKGYSK